MMGRVPGRVPPVPASVLDAMCDDVAAGSMPPGVILDWLDDHDRHEAADAARDRATDDYRVAALRAAGRVVCPTCLPPLSEHPCDICDDRGHIDAVHLVGAPAESSLLRPSPVESSVLRERARLPCLWRQPAGIGVIFLRTTGGGLLCRDVGGTRRDQPEVCYDASVSGESLCREEAVAGGAPVSCNVVGVYLYDAEGRTLSRLCIGQTNGGYHLISGDVLSIEFRYLPDAKPVARAPGV